MATRSFISRYDEQTKKYTAIYCHWDGYPTGVGATLRDHYTDDGKVRLLVNSNGISSLHENVSECPPISDEDPSLVFESLVQMMNHFRECWCEYGYVWMPSENRWECFELYARRVNLYAD